METDKIKEKIKELFDSTTDDIGVGFGYKQKDGEFTEELGFVFLVEHKKPLSELKPEEILPKKITVDGVEYCTDVRQVGKIVALQNLSLYPNCQAVDPTTYNNCYGWITSLPANDDYHPILKGGIGITSANWYGYVGTLGLIAVDTATQSLVGVTNNHVVVKDAFHTQYRNLYGILENEVSDITYQPAYFQSPSYEFGRVLRYKPIYPTGYELNLIDAAITSVNSSRIDINESYKQFGLSYTSPIPFATSTEITSTLTAGPILQSTGRTTGVKEGSPCGNMKVVATGVTINVGYNLQGNLPLAPFTDVIEFRRSFSGCPYPIYRGDSGSALIANFSGTYKIIGLNFAGNLDPNAYSGYACRIDHVADLLGIEAWTGGSKNYIDPNSIRVITTPGGTTATTINCSGLTYWQVGLSNYNNPC